MEVIKKSVGLLGANTYIIYDGKEAGIIDPGGDGQMLLDEIKSRGLNLRHIILTHGHFDHIDAVGILKDGTGASISIHREDAPCLGDIVKNLSFSLGIESIQPPGDLLLEDGDIIQIGSKNLEVIHTPGHSLGSICLLGDGFVFTGDTLFKGSIGRTDFFGGNSATLLESINTKLMALDDGIRVYPGHGPITTIGTERLANPFLRG